MSLFCFNSDILRGLKLVLDVADNIWGVTKFFTVVFSSLKRLGQMVSLG